MRRRPNKIGGGSKTNLNGLSFEGRTDLLGSFNQNPNFEVKNKKVFKNNKLVGEYFEKHDFYKSFLEKKMQIGKLLILRNTCLTQFFIIFPIKLFISLKKNIKKDQVRWMKNYKHVISKKKSI